MSFRKKLEPQNDKSLSTRVDSDEQHIRAVQVPEADTQSVLQVEMPPWAESYEISSTEMDGVLPLFSSVQLNV